MSARTQRNLQGSVALRARLRRKLRRIAALDARTQYNLQGFAAFGPAPDFQEMAGGPKSAPRVHIPMQNSLGFCSGKGRGLWATCARCFATLGAQTQCNLRGMWPWECGGRVIYEGSWHWERGRSVIYKGSWPWERESRVIYEGSSPWERESGVNYKGSRP